MLVLRSPSPAAGTPRAVSSELPTISPELDALGDVAADAAVVVGETVELEVLDEPIEPDGDARRPVEDLGSDLGGDRIGARVGQVEDARGSLDSLLSIAAGSADSTRATRSSISSTSTWAPVWACTCVKSEYMSSIPGYVWPRKPMRAVRRSCTACAASSHSRERVPGGVAVEQRPGDRPVGDRAHG